MISTNTLAADAKAIITKAVSDCSNNEIALDSLAQWAFNPTGNIEGFGIEENYPAIKENLIARFDLSDANASEVVEKLRAYGAQFMLLATNPTEVRAMILDLLRSDLGDKWRDGIVKRMSKASNETKRVACLVLHLIQRGYEISSIENVLDDIEAFHVAAFEKPFSLSDRQRDLKEIGFLNRLVFTSENSIRQNVHIVNNILSSEMFGFKLKDLKVNLDTKGLVDHLYEKKAYDQLVSYDDLFSANFGIKKVQDESAEAKFDKKIVGAYHGLVAASPFMLETIRDDFHKVRRRILDAYELRIDTALLATIRESWPDGKSDLFHPREARALWRLDNAIDPKLYVYATPWLIAQDVENLASKIEVPNVSTLVFTVLNQTPESARAILKDRISGYGHVLLVYSLNQKESYIEVLSGEKTAFSEMIAKSVSRALNLSTHTSELTRVPKRPEGIQVGLGTQFGKSESSKVLIGMQETKGIYWSPTRERNWNFGVFGESGSGKSEVIKKILSQLKANHLSYLVLDSFGEYASGDPLNPEFGVVVNSSEIAVNPLELSSGNSPRDQIYQVADTINAIYNLSDTQLQILRVGLAKAYLAKGIFDDSPETWRSTPPILMELHRFLVGREQDSKEVKDLLQKIGSWLTLPLFSRTKTAIPLEKLVSSPMILHLGALQSNELKSLASEFILAKIPSVIESQTGDPQLFVVVDGAPNLFHKHSFSLQLLMDARRRGVGLIFPYRDPGNLPEIAFNSTATIMTFRQSDSKVAKLTAERLNTTEQVLNKNLTDKFSAVVRFSSMTEVTRLTAVPYTQK